MPRRTRWAIFGTRTRSGLIFAATLVLTLVTLTAYCAVGQQSTSPFNKERIVLKTAALEGKRVRFVAQDDRRRFFSVVDARWRPVLPKVPVQLVLERPNSLERQNLQGPWKVLIKCLSKGYIAEYKNALSAWARKEPLSLKHGAYIGHYRVLENSDVIVNLYSKDGAWLTIGLYGKQGYTVHSKESLRLLSVIVGSWRRER